jgi:hypothetical protein
MFLYLVVCMLSLVTASAQQGRQRSDEVKPLVSYRQRQSSPDVYRFDVRPRDPSDRVYQLDLDLTNNSLRDLIKRANGGQLIWGFTIHGMEMGFGYSKPMVNRYGNGGSVGSWPRLPGQKPAAFNFQIRF